MTNFEKFTNVSVSELASKFSKISAELCDNYEFCRDCPLRWFGIGYRACRDNHSESGFIDWFEREVEE